MQVPKQSRMGKAQRNMAGYICGYVDNNEVGEKGCRHLSKATWRELEVIYLCHLSLTQTGTQLGKGAADTSAGKISRE